VAVDAGGPATTVVTGHDGPFGLAVDASHIYWANIGDNTIKEAPLAGGPATTVVTSQGVPAGVAVGP
jgi:hypothetical protein